MTICEKYSQHCFEQNDAHGQHIADSILDDICSIATADVVSVEAYKQILWERNLAMKQLEEHGIPFGGEADVVEVRHGEWEKFPFGMRICSECRYLQGKKKRFEKRNYCPNCGAKMDGEE